MKRKNPMDDPEIRAMMAASQRRRYAENPELRQKMADIKNKLYAENPELIERLRNATTEHYRKHPETGWKHSERMSGENSPNWQGGKSFEPYCHRFTETLKESIRNKFGGRCTKCGKSEIRNGKRLSIHHIDHDKMQGCNDSSWYLAPLCISCHSILHRRSLDEHSIEEFLLVSNLPQFGTAHTTEIAGSS